MKGKRIGKSGLLFIFVSIILVGAWTPFGSHKQKLDQALDKINTYVSHQQWAQAEHEHEHLMKVYHKEKWLLQLMGDEGEYEEINHSVNKLEAAIKTKSVTQAKMEIGNLKAVIYEIFSL